MSEEVIEMTEHGASSCRRIPANDPQTLEYLVSTYSDALVRYAYCYVGSSAAAEDIMEDAFAALLIKGGKLTGEEQTRAWLYKTVHNKAVDYLRRHSREVPLEDVENVLHTPAMEQNVLTRERNEKIYICMQKLSAQYREVLQLTYFDGFPVETVCRIMGRSRKQVYNLLFRGKVALKELLIKEGITHEDL